MRNNVRTIVRDHAITESGFTAVVTVQASKTHLTVDVTSRSALRGARAVETIERPKSGLVTVAGIEHGRDMLRRAVALADSPAVFVEVRNLPGFAEEQVGRPSDAYDGGRDGKDSCVSLYVFHGDDRQAQADAFALRAAGVDLGVYCDSRFDNVTPTVKITDEIADVIFPFDYRERGLTKYDVGSLHLAVLAERVPA